MYKVPYYSPLSPGFLERIYQVVKSLRECHGCGEEYNVIKGKEKQNNLPYIAKAVGKNTVWGKWEGNGSFFGKNQDYLGWGTLYTPKGRFVNNSDATFVGHPEFINSTWVPVTRT